jgi:quinol monooxygenase YgiN
MIHVIATIETVSGRRGEFLAHFRELVPQVQAEAGCLEYGPAIDLATDIEAQAPPREGVVTVIEKWSDLSALRDHLAAPHMTAYREKVKDLVAGVTIHVLEPASSSD